MIELGPKEKTVLAHSIIAFIIVLTIFIGFKFISELKGYAFIGDKTASANTIAVTGEGDIFAVPDIATIDFTVTSTNIDVQTAQEAVTTQTNKALASLGGLGINDADIQTTDYEANPQYSSEPSCSLYPCPINQTQKIIGYIVSQTIEVKVRDTSLTGKVLGDLGSLGITQISGPNFTIDNNEILQEQARKKAITDAEANAVQLASDLGVHLVKIINFSEDNNNIVPVMYAARSSSAIETPSPSIPAGQNKISSNVTITYEIN